MNECYPWENPALCPQGLPFYEEDEVQGFGLKSEETRLGHRLGGRHTVLRADSQSICASGLGRANIPSVHLG